MKQINQIIILIDPFIFGIIKNVEIERQIMPLNRVLTQKYKDTK